jgi:hypothetical protein
MERIFLIRASQASKILGKIGLTEIQYKRMQELQFRKYDPKQKPLTLNMFAELEQLEKDHNNPSLPQTCKTYLHEWYANDNDIMRSKYTDKGEYVEDELIDFAAEKLGYGIAEKNRVRLADEFFTGECDVNLHDAIIDVKASWNKKTLHEQALKGIDYDYKIQLIVYCHLYKKEKGILFFGLMDTPPDVNYGNEILYNELLDNERWIAYEVLANPEIIEALKARVKACRVYLEQYDELIKSKLGVNHGV